MVESDDGPPIVGLPERFDRRLRLGPFPSAHDALKFVTYAAIGALLSPFTSAWVWLPVVLAGFAVSVWRPDGQAVDERALAFVAWKLRTVGPKVVMKTRSPRPLVRQGLLQIAPHQYVAVLRTGGTPVAYLPPEELARRFELYRELLRSTDASFSLLVTTTPMHSQAVRPVTAPEDVRETTAFTGYSELVSVLCRRRFLRRVYFALVTLEADSDAVGRLEGRAANLMERLGALGLRPTRLRDRALAEAARRFGWTVEGAEE